MRNYWNNLRSLNRDVHFILIGSAVTGFVFFGIYSLLLNLYLLRLGYGTEFIGLVNGVGPLMLAIASLPAGLLCRRFGSRRILMSGYLLMTLFFALLPMNEMVPLGLRQAWIVVSYAGAWAAGGLGLVAGTPFLMAATTAKEQSYAFAVSGAISPLAGFVGSLLGGQLPSLFAGWLLVDLSSPAPFRYTLLLAAVVELLAVVAIWHTQEKKASVSQTAVSATKSTANTRPPYRPILLIGLVAVLAVCGSWTMRIFFNVYLDTVLAAPTSLIGTLSALALFAGLAALLSPQAIERWGKKRLIFAGRLGIAAAFLPLIFIHHWLAVGIGYIVMLATLSLTDPSFYMFSQLAVEPRWRTTMSSVFSMAAGIGISLTAFGGGFVITNFGFQTLFVTGAALSVVAAAIFWTAFGERKAVSVSVGGGLTAVSESAA